MNYDITRGGGGVALRKGRVSQPYFTESLSQSFNNTQQPGNEEEDGDVYKFHA